MWSDLLIIALLCLCSAFFSGSETGLTAVTRGRIYHLIKAGNSRARKVAWLREHKERLIGTLLLGNTLVNIAASAIGTAFAIKLVGEEGVLYATVFMTAIIFLFSEVLPKTFAIQYSERTALMVAPPVAFLVKTFSPITIAVQWFVRKFLHLFGIDITQKDTLISATDAIRGTIEWHHREGGMVKDDRDMLGSILDMRELTVGDIMVHRQQVETIDASLSAEEIIAQAIGSAHSRLPFWRGNPENIIGVLHVKDLTRLLAAQSPGEISRERIVELLSDPWFIPETTGLREQLHAFRERRKHFAHVVNEYGAFLGIVTLEDAIEEIVGQIEDEYDRGKTGDIIAESGGAFTVKASVTIRDLNRELDWSLPDEQAVTVGGLVILEARAIPEIGSSFDFHSYRFTVLDKKSNQLLKLKIEKLKEEP